MVEHAHKRHAYHLNRLVQRDTTETTTTCSGGLLGGFQNCVTRTITHKSTPTSNPPVNNPPPSSKPPTQSTPRSSAPPASSPPASSSPENNDSPPTSTSKSSKAAEPSSTSRANAAPRSSPPASQPTSSPPPAGDITPGSSTALVIPNSSGYVLGNSALPQSEPIFSSTTDGTALPSGTTANLDDSSSNSHTSAVVGGIVAGIAGIVVVGFIALYFIRRYKQRQEDRDAGDIFASQYRRQSAILVEDEFSGDAGGGMAGMIGAGGYKPRPPTMIERHLANGAGTGAGGVSYGHDQYAQHPTFPQNGMPQHYHEQSPTDQYYDTGAPGTFSVGDYAEMNRGTGVTPMQAAQYAAISEQIHAGGQHHAQQAEYDPDAYYQQPTGHEQWNNGSPYEEAVQAPQPAAMAYDFPMTPNSRPSPDEVAQYQVRAQSPPSLGKRREPTAYNVSAPHRQNSGY